MVVAVASPAAGLAMPVQNLTPAFSPLDRIHSAEIPPAEGMLALNVSIPSCRGDEEAGATLSRRKTAQSGKSERIEGDQRTMVEDEEAVEEEWTYPDGGRKAWGVVAVRSILPFLLSFSSILILHPRRRAALFSHQLLCHSDSSGVSCTRSTILDEFSANQCFANTARSTTVKTYTPRRPSPFSRSWLEPPTSRPQPSHSSREDWEINSDIRR